MKLTVICCFLNRIYIYRMVQNVKMNRLVCAFGRHLKLIWMTTRCEFEYALEEYDFTKFTNKHTLNNNNSYKIPPEWRSNTHLDHSAQFRNSVILETHTWWTVTNGGFDFVECYETLKAYAICEVTMMMWGACNLNGVFMNLEQCLGHFFWNFDFFHFFSIDFR